MQGFRELDRPIEVGPNDKDLLVPKLLADHQAAHAAVHDADADAAELGTKDVGAVAGGVHQARVGDRESWGESEILAGGQKLNVRLVHAIEGRETFGRVVGKVAAREHVR